MAAARERFAAVGRVLRPGRTLAGVSGELPALQGAARKLIGAMQATMIAVTAVEQTTDRSA